MGNRSARPVATHTSSPAPTHTSSSTTPSQTAAQTSTAPRKSSSASVGVRRNIKDLTADEITRLQLCFFQMQQTNDWLLTCGIHGGGLPQISDVKIDTNKAWCHHRKETFPIWHRPYLWEFESIMQKYDPTPEKGRLMLPYWDWSTPGVDRKLPAALTDARVQLTIGGKLQTVANPLASGPSKDSVRTKNGSRTHRGKLDLQGVQEAADDAYAALQEDNYPEFASKNSPISIETAHGLMHVAVGGDGDMSDVGRAAFDPVFWMHHNNVERLFYSFQVMNPRLQSEHMEKQVLDPFPPRADHGKIWSWANNTGKHSISSEWWDISTLDYKYDTLATVPDRGNQIRERNRFVVFWDVPHPMQTVMVHVYIKKKGEVYVHPVDEKTDPTRAGTICIFAFNRNATDSYCDECNKQEDTNYTLNVTNFLDNLGLRNKEETFASVDITVRITDAGGSEVNIKDTFKKPFPDADLLWENEFLADEIDFSKVQDSTRRDVQRLRDFLKYYGYVQGKGAKNLNDALRKFQAQYGLDANGVLDEKTQKFISRPRSANNDIADSTKPVLLNRLVKGFHKIHYTIGDIDQDLVDPQLPDLGLSKLLGVLEKAFKAWGDPLGEKIGHKIQFVYVDHDAPKVELVIDWNLFDGVGGTLGFANSSPAFGSSAIELDRAERWTFDDKPYSVQAVVAHELGHLFGLQHSPKQDTIMNPYYRENFLAPTAKDIDDVFHLYQEKKKKQDEAKKEKTDH